MEKLFYTVGLNINYNPTKSNFYWMKKKKITQTTYVIIKHVKF